MFNGESLYLECVDKRGGMYVHVRVAVLRTTVRSGTAKT